METGAVASQFSERVSELVFVSRVEEQGCVIAWIARGCEDPLPDGVIIKACSTRGTVEEWAKGGLAAEGEVVAIKFLVADEVNRSKAVL